MTRKDYVLIADVLASFKAGIALDDAKALNDYLTLVMMMAGELSNDNPRFDRARFTQACEAI